MPSSKLFPVYAAKLLRRRIARRRHRSNPSVNKFSRTYALTENTKYGLFEKTYFS